MHQRDDELTSDIKLREPEEYHAKEVRDKQQQYRIESERSKRSRVSAILTWMNEKTEEIHRSCKELAEVGVIDQRLTKLIERIEQWVPPTVEHESYKAFMLEQLKITYDTDVLWKKEYHIECLQNNPLCIRNPVYDGYITLEYNIYDCRTEDIRDAVSFYSSDNDGNLTLQSNGLHHSENDIQLISRIAKAFIEYETEHVEDLLRSIKYHQEEYSKEVDRCKKVNDWILELKRSLV